jgi:hypothetical protein
MTAKPNLPNEIFWGREYSLRKDMQVNFWLAMAAIISSLADIIFRHTVQHWPLEGRVAVVLVEFLCLALWSRAMTRWIRGMDELHRRIMTSVVLFAVGATFFFMMLWHRLDREGLFNALLAQPKPGASWDICTVCNGFLLFVLFYGIAQVVFNRRYK